MSRGLPAADALSSRPLAMVRNLVHIHPTAELAERVLLPGDPGRALRLAQELLDEPKMLNHNRGLWGYTGTAADGRLLSIQSTGMGGPSAAIVATELIELGARRLLRIGTCGGLDPELEPGQLLVVERGDRRRRHQPGARRPRTARAGRGAGNTDRSASISRRSADRRRRLRRSFLRRRRSGPELDRGGRARGRDGGRDDLHGRRPAWRRGRLRAARLEHGDRPSSATRTRGAAHRRARGWASSRSAALRAASR